MSEPGRDNEFMRAYGASMLSTRVFGAILTAVEHRLNSGLMSKTQIAQNMGMPEDAVRELLERPGNWELSTIAHLAHALDLKMSFVFTARDDESVAFCDTGIVAPSAPD